MTITHLGHLTPDRRNARRHGEQNISMISRSLETDGFGRSILLDAEGNILAGNGVTEAAGNVGLEEVIVVPSDGTKVVAVQRTDVLPGSERAVRLAIADNRTTELSDFDPAVVAELSAEVDLSDFWRDDELELLLFDVDTAIAGAVTKARVLGDSRPRVTAVLVVDDLATVEAALVATGIDNRGEAFVSICKAYLDAQEG